jgi:ribosomal protein L11 methyltransferase
MSKFIELTVSTTHVGGELISDVLWGYTDLGVVINDVEDVIALARDGRAWDYADESIFKADKTVLVKAYFPVENAMKTIKQVETDLIKMKSESPLDLGSLETVKREIDGDLWREQWKEHFKPIHIGKVVIVPEWIDYKQTQDEIKILLDSNMAFGTGEHETTSMCVELMQEYITPSSTCIDVGCGSGILGISAIKLGAAKAYLTDIDPIAVESATHNAALNGVAEKTVVAHANLLDDTEVQGDIMMANITGEVLKMLAPSIPKNLKQDGVLILSGIIESRLEMVKSAYEAVGMQVVFEKRKGEWFALVLKHS